MLGLENFLQLRRMLVADRVVGRHQEHALTHGGKDEIGLLLGLRDGGGRRGQALVGTG